jgi:hypothetical protein
MVAMDRLLQPILTIQITGLAAVTGTGGLYFGFRGMLELLNSQIAPGIAHLLIGTTMACGAYILCRHRNELTWC